MTVATMITDCLAGDETLDCADKTLDVVLVNDGNSDPADNGLGSFFSDTGTPVGTYNHSGGPKGLALVPSQMIFAEPYPKNFTNYFTPSAIAVPRRGSLATHTRRVPLSDLGAPAIGHPKVAEEPLPPARRSHLERGKRPSQRGDFPRPFP